VLGPPLLGPFSAPLPIELLEAEEHDLARRKPSASVMLNHGLVLLAIIDHPNCPPFPELRAHAERAWRAFEYVHQNHSGTPEALVAYFLLCEFYYRLGDFGPIDGGRPDLRLFSHFASIYPDSPLTGLALVASSDSWCLRGYPRRAKRDYEAALRTRNAKTLAGDLGQAPTGCELTLQLDRRRYQSRWRKVMKGLAGAHLLAG
jgi:hypothetical protein